MPMPEHEADGMEERVQRTVESFSPGALRTARRRRHWSHEDLADASGVSATTIGTWERGEARPTVTNLAAVAGALRLSVADLVRPSAGAPTLTDYRVACGLTLAAAGASAGFSTATVSRAENAHGRLTDRVITALARTYKVTEQEIEAAWARSSRARLARLREQP